MFYMFLFIDRKMWTILITFHTNGDPCYICVHCVCAWSVIPRQFETIFFATSCLCDTQLYFLLENCVFSRNPLNYILISSLFSSYYLQIRGILYLKCIYIHIHFSGDGMEWMMGNYESKDRGLSLIHCSLWCKPGLWPWTI